jgi:DNA-directed RNA polymerase alpha subunit
MINLRDWLAGIAMQGLVYAQAEDFDPAFTAEASYNMADAMLEERERQKQKSHMSLNEFDFSVRIRNCLEAAKITTTEELIERGPTLHLIENMGRVSLKKIQEELFKHGIYIRVNHNFAIKGTLI